MWGLTRYLSKYKLIKVFANLHEGHESFDKKVSFSIERVGGVKFIRKYRKSYLINDYLKKNHKIECIIGDHWKSLELIKSKKKKICLIHSKEINHKKNSRLNLRSINVLNNVDHVVANSNYTKNLAIEIGVKPEKIIVINPGIDRIKKLNTKSLLEAENFLKNKHPRLITISRFDKRKNHEKVIMSLKNLKQIYPNIIYICVGYGDEEENIKKLVKELDLNEQVLFFKNISQDLKNAIMAKSHVFVMPSIIYKKSVEGFGIGYIEAAQYSLPSIGGKDGGASDAIINNKTGFICDGNKLEEIYSSLDLILKNNSFNKLGKNAKEYVKKFEWENIINEYLKII